MNGLIYMKNMMIKMKIWSNFINVAKNKMISYKDG